jgi:hypothetical protein
VRRQRPRARNHERARHKHRHLHAHGAIEGRKADERSFVYGIACERAIKDLDLASAIFNCDASGGKQRVRGQESEGAF